MKFAPINMRDVPIELIRQKEDFVTPEFFHVIADDPSMLTFALLTDDGDIMGVWWAFVSVPYGTMYIDTLIIDKEHRSSKNLRDALTIMREVMMATAAMRDIPAITVTVSFPKLMGRMFPKAEATATVFKEEVE